MQGASPSCVSKRTRTQRGSAIIFILLGIALFAALCYAFMKGMRGGTDSYAAQQAKLKAQEILNYYNAVDRTINKLRMKGCSESDISFYVAGDTDDYITVNNPASAPPDKSCDVFDTAGGGLPVNIQWSNYQIPLDQIDTASQYHRGKAYYRIDFARIIGVGASDTHPDGYDIMMQLNFVDPKVCDAYNKILGYDIDLTISDSSAPTGDENTDLAGKYTSCYLRHTPSSDYYQIRYVWSPH